MKLIPNVLCRQLVAGKTLKWMFNEMSLSLAKDSTRSALGLTTSYRLAGTGGNEFSRSGLGGTAVLINESGYFDALREIGKLKTPTWTVALAP